MLVFWKKNEKEERELRKKAEKEALEQLRQEEERREAQRQARKLNFLITQTELYSHFIGRKIKQDTGEDEETAVPESEKPTPTPERQQQNGDEEDQEELDITGSAEEQAFGEIDFDEGKKKLQLRITSSVYKKITRKKIDIVINQPFFLFFCGEPNYMVLLLQRMKRNFENRHAVVHKMHWLNNVNRQEHLMKVLVNDVWLLVMHPPIFL